HDFRSQAAEFLAVDRQDGGRVMFGVAVLDLVEAVMKRLIADRGACLARLEAIAMQLVMMVGMLRLGLTLASGDQADCACSEDAQKIATNHGLLLHVELIRKIVTGKTQVDGGGTRRTGPGSPRIEGRRARRPRPDTGSRTERTYIAIIAAIDR